jgi:hypothetical protein
MSPLHAAAHAPGSFVDFDGKAACVLVATEEHVIMRSAELIPALLAAAICAGDQRYWREGTWRHYELTPHEADELIMREGAHVMRAGGRR